MSSSFQDEEFTFSHNLDFLSDDEEPIVSTKPPQSKTSINDMQIHCDLGSKQGQTLGETAELNHISKED